MNCVLFAKLDQVFSLKKKQNNKGILEKMEKKYWKSLGKIGEFCQSGKVETVVSSESLFFW